MEILKVLSLTWIVSIYISLSINDAKLRKVESKTKELAFFLPRRSKFAFRTQSYEKTSEEPNLFELFRVSVTSTESKLVKKDLKSDYQAENLSVFCC